MKNLFVRIVFLTLGQIVNGVGIAFTVRANIGYAPWEVFHAGIGNTIGLTMGVTSIIVGLAIVIFVTAMGEKIGLGTIMGITVTGLILDLVLYIDIIPEAGSIFVGILMLFAGMFIIAIGTYFYIKPAFGAGPRDNLMVVLAKKTKFPVGVCRSAVECMATLIGWLLGGMVGYGTIISMIGIGFCVQITFKALRFDPTKIEHETLAKTFKKR